MLKKLILATAGIAALAMAASAAQAETVTIRYSSWLPVNHWYVGGSIVPYLEEIEEVTEGRVKVEILPKIVGTPQSQFDVVRDGLADMSWIVTGYTPGRFKLSEMGELAFGGDSTATGPAFHRTYMEHFAKFNEFEGVEVVAIYTGSPGHVATKDRIVETIDDFKGLKLRSAAAGATEALNLLGAVPILKSAAEAFEMLSTGAIDGSLMIPETVVSANSLDLLNTFTVVPGGFFNTVHAIIINPEKWNAISEDDQEAILAISGEKLAATVGKAYAKQNAEAFDAMEEAGYTIGELDAEQTAKLQEALAPIEEKWIEEAIAIGVENPAEILAEFRESSPTN
ncbi:MAG: TRAP transporter substrate-binding protein [Rhizobiaceae bacterium]|nr:TRAP transporter substrate-binding protein [Rhizobiaceae bacterium]MCV0404936.1 TRAP transporter substrate-binding protein [Rhizobiaceae bacterium]